MDELQLTRQLLDRAPVLAFVKSLDQRYLVVNRQLCETYGVRAEDLIGRTNDQAFPGEDLSRTAALHDQVVRERRSLTIEEVIEFKGADLTFLTSRFPLFDHAGEVIAVGGIAVDVTARATALAELKATEQRYRHLVEAMERQKRLLDRTQALARVGGWELHRPSGTLLWTLETYRIHGVEPGSYTPTLPSALAFFSGGGAKKLRRAIDELPDGGSFDLELALDARTGEHRTVRVVGAVEGDQITGAMHDLTNRRLLEEQLLQSQKLESLGRLAGGIAHDFNNLLTVISNAVEFLDRTLPAGAAQDIQDIQRATRRAADLTTQMLAFARRQGGTARPFSANMVVERTARMMARLIGEDVTVQVELMEPMGAIRADPAHLEQVLVNLMVNARDAMPDGGRLVLRGSRRCPPGKEPGAEPRAGSWICIEVVDSGAGMSIETQRRVFEPFFTTKPPGKGTGLGLSTVYGILQRWGGDVTVQSTLGSGTTIQTWWPEHLGAALEDSDEGPVDAPSIGDETILLVEDDDAVRRVTARGLRGAGFEVAVADGPEVALALARSRAEPFDLLVTDVVMPGIDGIELAGRLRALHPQLRVLFVSGYAADALEERGLPITHFELLHKPFNLQELTSRVRSVLDRRR